MKKKNIIFIIVGIILIIVMVGGCFIFLNKTEYTLTLPKGIDNFSSIALEFDGDVRTIENSENMQNLMDKLIGTGRTTYEESFQELPTSVDGKIAITFNDDKESRIFIYKKNGKYYIEQPYNGVYEITEGEYNDISIFYQGLREEVTNLEKTSLINRVEKLEPVDWLGKSFKTSDLTNEELLRLGFSLFGPVKNFGFIDITFEDLSRTYIKGFLGREDAFPQNIVCSCDKVISTYNNGNDTFTWNSEFHYLDHKSNVYNEILDIYRVEDKYIVKVYKIFSDIMLNSSTMEYNFYSTYNDAINEENVLFTVTNESDFTSALEVLDDNKKVLYKLTFKRDGTFKLVDYEIKENK